MVAFLEGSGTDTDSRRLSDIWQFDDDEIDYTHDFIQWMFPLREASGANF
ncbi:MAG: opioid growth factor receptor-related protein [Betaproteobacteria bacterium]